MKTYYVIFKEDQTVSISFNKDFESEQYTYIMTRMSDEGIIEYYTHNSKADFYKKALIDGILV